MSVYGFKNSIVFGSINSSFVKSFKILKISKTFSWLYSGIFSIYFIFSTSLLSLSYCLVKTSKALFNKDFTALLVPFTVLQLLSACSWKHSPQINNECVVQNDIVSCLWSLHLSAGPRFSRSFLCCLIN